MKKKLIIIGGQGSGEIAMSVFQEVNNITNEWLIEGFLNDIVEPGKLLGKYKVLGPSEAVVDYVNRGYYIHYALHFNAKNKEQRVKIFEEYNIPEEANATAIHPRAYIDPSTEIGYGCLICAQTATSFNTKINNFIHMYTNSFLGHDSELQNYSTQAAHSVIGARNIVQTGAHVGLNSTTKENIIIGKYSIVGMGAVVTKNVANYDIVVGNPAKFFYSLKNIKLEDIKNEI
jgi:acetyltransferase EpsM